MTPSTTHLSAVIGIGASAGGLEPLENLFAAMPLRTGCAFVIIQHLSPDFKSLMDDLLARRTSIPIIKAENHTLLRSDHIYIPPPGTRVSIKGHQLLIEASAKEPAGSTRIDHFLSDLASQWENKAVGIILSGSGSDGSKGAAAIKENGGFVLCQSTDSAQFESMPHNVMRNIKVDHSCSPEAMPEHLLALLQQHNEAADPAYAADAHSLQEEPEPGELEPLFAALYERFGIQFSEYKPTTVQRRVLRRIGLRKGMARSQYLEEIVHDTEELDALYHDLLIGVTRFFRDPETFNALRQPLAEKLRQKQNHEEFRIWAAGCATGEEAYSLAFVVNDLAQKEGFTGKIVLYATDAHRRSLGIASAAVYPKEAIESVPDEYRDPFLIPKNHGQFQVQEDIRRQVVFAPHNLLQDPPFTRIDLVSCRNVLIYLQPTAQARLLKSLNYALQPDGLFFLGASEELSQLADYFRTVDKKAKVFRKIRQVAGLPSFSAGSVARKAATEPVPVRPAESTAIIGKQLLHAYDTLLQRHIPAGLLLNPSGEILHFFGDGEQFLAPLSGRPSVDIFGRLDGQLRIAVRSLMDQIASGKPYLEYSGVPREDNSTELLDLSASAIADPGGGDPLIHLQFTKRTSETTAPESAQDSDSVPYQPDHQSKTRIQELESELTSTRANLQATVEELQTTNEELQASNEEMLSSNEELQSTNEELQSVNEELYSVNSEYAAKNEELSNLNAEHDGLLESLSVGVIFIDRELRIRRFNRAINEIVNLLPQDIGRPLDHLASLLSDENQLLEDARAVMEDGQSRQSLVQTRSGKTYLQRTVPFQQEPGIRDGVVLSFADLTEIQQTREELKRSEERLNLAIESARQGIWEANPISGEALFGDSFYRILGYEPEAFPASMDAFRDLLHPDDRKRRWQRLLVKMEKKEPFSIEFRVRHQSGNWLWVACSGQVRQSTESGQSNRVIGLLTDIHDRKQMEFMMRENERKLELSLESASQIWWEWEIPNHILRTHGVGDCILGYACHDIDKSEDFWWNRIPEEEIPEVKASLERHFAGEEKYWYSEHRYRTSHGRFEWVREMGQIIQRDEQGQPFRMIGITQHDHDRKQNLLDLQRNRELYGSIVEDQQDLICRYTPDLRLTFANRAFAECFDSSPDDLLGRHWLELLPPDQVPVAKQAIQQLHAGEPLRTHELVLRRADGSPRHIQWTHRAFLTDSGSPREYQSAGRDITLLKEQEDSLRKSLDAANEARQRAEMANKAKSDFLAAMNHELRTPLNPIIVGSELLQDGVDPANRELASMIHSAGNHLLHLINSVLDLSKLEADKLEPTMAPFNPSAFLGDLVEIFRNSAEKKGLDYAFTAASDLPASVISDSSLLRQVILNLVNNAIKFTESGSVAVTAGFQAAGQPETGQLSIEVSDTGIGIPENLTKTIFDPFTQADSGVSRKFGGTGIGLTISRRVAQLLGGDITVSSTEGEGSTFRILIPVSLPEPSRLSSEDARETSPSTQQDLSSLRILVVDDDAINRQILEASLRKRVQRITTAEDGIEAIHLTRKEPFDILIMDIHMPNLDGFETTRSIMEDPDVSPKPAFLFLSADTRKEMENQALDHKGAGFLRKPVTPSKLLAAVAAIADDSNR